MSSNGSSRRDSQLKDLFDIPKVPREQPNSLGQMNASGLSASIEHEPTELTLSNLLFLSPITMDSWSIQEHWACYSLGEPANPEDIEPIYAWKRQVVKTLAHLMIRVYYKQMDAIEFHAVQHSPIDTPVTKLHPSLVSFIEPIINGDAVTRATKNWKLTHLSKPTSNNSKSAYPPKAGIRAVPSTDGSEDTAILGDSKENFLTHPTNQSTSGSVKKSAGPPNVRRIRKTDDIFLAGKQSLKTSAEAKLQGKYPTKIAAPEHLIGVGCII
ncbi:hypothetical protein F5146DRAFT_994602 [Armillaria mellea]|nr:hypothetical protein F5146DRAFT_994602 [Armillaria mellea]